MRTELRKQTVTREVQVRNVTAEWPWSVYSKNTATGTVIDIERDDVHKTAVTDGFRPPLPYFAEGSTAAYPAIYADVTQLTGGKRYDTIISGYMLERLLPGAMQDLIPQTDINRAIITMLKAVGDSKWSAGEMIAEMQGSINLIAQSARKLSLAMTAARRRDWRGIAKALDVPPKKVKSGTSAARGWLEYQFGWAPVVSDIANSALFLSGAMDTRDPPIIMASAQMQLNNVFVTQDSYSVANGIGSVRFPYEDRRTVSDEWKASVYFTLNDDLFRGLSQYGIAGLSTPWALLPMSYLADWVLPIGDFLAALDATIGLTWLGGSQTRFKKSRKVRHFGSVTGGTNSMFVRTGNAYVEPVDAFKMDRSVWASPPVPVPLYVKNPFDTFKAVTSVALLKQFSSGSK